MKKVAINLKDLLDVLQAMHEDGTYEVLLFEHDGLPALADKENPEDIITFQVYDKTIENKDGESVH